MKRIVVVTAALCASLWAQQTQPPAQEGPRAPEVQKIFQVKYADVGRIARILNNLGASINWDSTMRVISVRGRPETVTAIEEAIKRLDVPGIERNIEVTAYLLHASPQAASQPEPGELAPVLKQMRALFPYKGYRLLDVVVMRGRDGRGGSTDGTLSEVSTAAVKPNYSVYYDTASLSQSDGARFIRLDKLRLRVNMPKGNIGIETDVDVKEGQKVVVGKASVSGADEAIILVLSAKVVD